MLYICYYSLSKGSLFLTGNILPIVKVTVSQSADQISLGGFVDFILIPTTGCYPDTHTHTHTRPLTAQVTPDCIKGLLASTLSLYIIVRGCCVWF